MTFNVILDRFSESLKLERTSGDLQFNCLFKTGSMFEFWKGCSVLCPVEFWKLSKDRNATVSLGNPFLHLISLMGKKSYLNVWLSPLVLTPTPWSFLCRCCWSSEVNKPQFHSFCWQGKCFSHWPFWLPSAKLVPFYCHLSFIRWLQTSCGI